MYLTYGFFSVGSAYIAQRNKSIGIALFSYLICIFFWGFRYEIGFDYIGYVEIFNDISHGENSYVEVGYYFLNKIFASWPKGYIPVLFISSAITFGFLFVSFWKRGILWQGLFFSLVFQYQFMAANQVRQAMAIAAFFSFIHLLNNKKYIKYSICVIITALLIHTSAIILLLAIPISKIRCNRYVLCSIVVIVYIAYLMSMWSNFGTKILILLPIPENYSHFLLTERIFSENIGFSLVQLFNIGMGIYIIWNKMSVPNYLISLYFSGLILYIVFVEFHLFLRLSFYFSYVNIIALSIICKKNPRRTQVIILISAIFFFLVCCQTTNMHGIIPYKSIFY